MSIEKFSGVLNNKTQQGFTIVLTSVAQKIKDFAVLGLYTYLASLPPEWIINVSHLESHCGKGKDYIYRLLNELIKLGLLERVEKREKGRFVRYEYNLYISPLPVFPDAAQPEAVKADTYKVNKEIKNKDDINLRADAPKKLKTDYEYPDTLYEKLKSKRTLSLENMLENNPFNIPIEYIQDWMEIRKIKRAPITLTVWSSVCKELKKCKESGVNVKDCFELMVANGWSILKFDWINKKENNSKQKPNGLDFQSTEWINGIADQIRVYHD